MVEIKPLSFFLNTVFYVLSINIELSQILLRKIYTIAIKLLGTLPHDSEEDNFLDALSQFLFIFPVLYEKQILFYYILYSVLSTLSENSVLAFLAISGNGKLCHNIPQPFHYNCPFYIHVESARDKFIATHNSRFKS